MHAGGRPVSEHAIVDSRPTRQVASVIEKLGASDRTQAVARAFDLGLLSARPPGAAAR